MARPPDESVTFTQEIVMMLCPSCLLLIVALATAENMFCCPQLGKECPEASSTACAARMRTV